MSKKKYQKELKKLKRKEQQVNNSTKDYWLLQKRIQELEERIETE